MAGCSGDPNSNKNVWAPEIYSTEAARADGSSPKQAHAGNPGWRKKVVVGRGTWGVVLRGMGWGGRGRGKRGVSPVVRISWRRGGLFEGNCTGRCNCEGVADGKISLRCGQAARLRRWRGSRGGRVRCERMNSESESARIVPGVLGGRPGRKVYTLEETQKRGLGKHCPL